MSKNLKIVFWLLIFMICVIFMPSAQALESGWPRMVPLEQGSVTIYTLQVDELSDGIIHFRAALAYRATPDSEPVFGAGWFQSPVEIDYPSRMVHPTDLEVIETRFPAGTDDVESELSAALAHQSPGWNLDFTVDELQASLETADAELQAQEKLNTAPPRIFYRDHPALLISIDGEPVLREIEDSSLQAVINTPYPLIFDGGQYYLNAAKDVWYRADQATGPYTFEDNPPANIATMVSAEEATASEEQTGQSVTAANAPEIVVSTEPAELIVTEGPAAFVPLVDDLLVLQNSQSDVFMHVDSQQYYIVLAGRWYGSGSLNGPWSYRPSDQLPPAFANIPKDSNQADSRVYVAGTEEANEAVLDTQVPQTAAVARGVVDMDVQYDGQPVYEAVDGTDMVYIRNTGSTVLLADGLYYLVEDGVWYVSASPGGPWQVAVRRPVQVDSILPTSPVHNVKYVQVYESTPEVVYVGYTPGYTGTIVHHNTIFYGSGWYYSPWVSPYYYFSRHRSWGFNVSYNPWYGWGFGLSWGWGPFNVGWYSGGYWHHDRYWHHRNWGYWGPGGYRHRPGHHGGGHNRYASNHYGNEYGNDYGHRGDRDSAHRERSNNLYRDEDQRASISDTRDRQMRVSDRQGGINRPVNELAASDARQAAPVAREKGKRSQARPVDSGIMRQKAELRDANATSQRGNLLSDSRQRPSRASDGQDSVNRPVNERAAHDPQQPVLASRDKGKRSQARPVSSSIMRQKAELRDATAAAQRQGLLSDNRDRTNRKTSRDSPRQIADKDSSRRPVSDTADRERRQSSSRSTRYVAQASPTAAPDKRAGQKQFQTDLYSSRQNQSVSTQNAVRQRPVTARGNSERGSGGPAVDRVSRQPSQAAPAGVPLPQSRTSSRTRSQRSVQSAPAARSATAPSRSRSAGAPQRSQSSSRPASSSGQRSAPSSSNRSRSSGSGSSSGARRPTRD